MEIRVTEEPIILIASGGHCLSRLSPTYERIYLSIGYFDLSLSFVPASYQLGRSSGRK